MSNKSFSSKKAFKYFIGYAHVNKIKALCVKLQKMSGYVKSFDETKCISF